MRGTLRQKIWILIGVCCAALCLIGVVSLGQISQLAAETAKVHAISEAVRQHMQGDMMHDAIRADLLASLLAKTPDELTAVRKDFREHADSFEATRKVLDGLALDSALRQKLSATHDPVDGYIKAAAAALERADINATSRVMDQHFIAVFSQLEEQLGAVGDDLTAASQHEVEASSAALRRAQKTLLLLFLAAVGVISMLLLTTGRQLVARIHRMLEVVHVARGGNLMRQIDHKGADELDELAEGFNQLVKTLREIILEASQATADVAMGMNEMASQAGQLLHGAETQAAKLGHIAAAVEQVSRSVAEVASASTVMVNMAEMAGKLAEEGGAIVGHTRSDIHQISANVTAGAASIAELGRSGERIGELITVITEIADQTNLLALNAAIEAARAGDHGRGFAVVADEVRKLADRTSRATVEVRAAISTIQTETTRAIGVMGEGTTRVSVGVQQAQKAEESLHQILSAARNVTGQIQNIAAATEQQSSAAEEITHTMSQVQEFARQVRDSAAVTAQSTTLLNEHTEGLRQRFARFTVA